VGGVERKRDYALNDEGLSEGTGGPFVGWDELDDISFGLAEYLSSRLECKTFELDRVGGDGVLGEMISLLSLKRALCPSILVCRGSNLCDSSAVFGNRGIVAYGAFEKSFHNALGPWRKERQSLFTSVNRRVWMKPEAVVHFLTFYFDVRRDERYCIDTSRLRELVTR
jgi:hypothetical protein